MKNQDRAIRAVYALAKEIQKAGFRVFIAEKGHYGFFSDAAGSRVVSFQYDLLSFSISGNYKTSEPQRNGSGWRITDDISTSSPNDWFNSIPFLGCLSSGSTWRYTTLKEHLGMYNASSRYTEITDEANSMTDHNILKQLVQVLSFEIGLDLDERRQFIEDIAFIDGNVYVQPVWISQQEIWIVPKDRGVALSDYVYNEAGEYNIHIDALKRASDIEELDPFGRDARIELIRRFCDEYIEALEYYGSIGYLWFSYPNEIETEHFTLYWQ